MRIINEKHLALVWNWDENERNELAVRYQTNLERLLTAIQERVNRNTPPPPDDLKELAGELQQAGESLQQAMESCFDSARALYAMAALTPEEREARKSLMERIRMHVGKNVVLKQTDAPELRGLQLTLEEVRGIKAMLRSGDKRWEALVDQLIPVIRYEASTDSRPVPPVPPKA